MTTQEVADLMHYHFNTIHALRQAGKLPFIRLGNAYRYPRAKILAIIDGNADFDTRQLELGRDMS